MKSSLFILLLGALTMLAACSPLRQVVTQLDLLTPKAEAVLTLVEDQYAQELQASDNPAAVKRKYDPIFEAYRGFRASWQAAREALAFASSLDNAGANAGSEIEAAVKALKAACDAYVVFVAFENGERAPPLLCMVN